MITWGDGLVGEVISLVYSFLLSPRLSIQVVEDDAVVAVMIVEASMHNSSISDMAAVLHSHFPEFPEDAHKYVTKLPVHYRNLIN